MNKTLPTVITAILLVIGSFVYSNSSSENAMKEEFLQWKSQYGIG